MPRQQQQQQQPEGIVINRFLAGLNTQRNPLVSPISFVGLRVIERTDALIDGLNVEISNSHTLVRRAGFPQYCSTSFSSDYPLNFYTFRKNNGTIYTLVDTQTAVYQFTPTTKTSIFTKGTTQQTQFQSVGSTLYFCNGTDLKKWDGTTVSNWGIVPPVTAPTLSFSAGALNPAIGYTYVYCFKNSTTGHVSTASGLSANTGKLVNQNITVQGARSTDTQVDKIQIYRTLDGGSNLYLLTEIANPPSGTWSYTDSNADSVLNNLISAPLSFSNNPPPAGMSNVCFYQGRMWGTVGNLLYFSGGGDVLNGVPEEAWPPANVLKFRGNITALQPSGAGLMVFTSDTVSVVLGGASTLSYYPQIMWTNFGVLSQNCVASDTDTLYIYNTNGQLMSVTASSKDEVGFNIGDQLRTYFNPATAYVTAHRNGTDAGLLISDMQSRVFRYSFTASAWSTMYSVVGGIGAIGSIETVPGTYTLLAGRATAAGHILSRDITNFQDEGQSYPGFFTIGSLTTSQPGTEPMTIGHIIADRMPIGSEISVSLLMNDISGTFTNIPWGNVSDPWNLTASTGVVSHRYDLANAQSALPQIAKHLQLRIDFATEAARNEILSVAIQPPLGQ